jgi:uncharacterized tellurite resistance protein B-like protein
MNTFLKRILSKKKMSHVKNLIEVALSDGNIDEEEIVLLLNLAQSLGITQQEIYQIRINPGKVAFTPPFHSKDRFNQIYDLVCMMMVDGQIDENELKLCKDLALKLGYMPLIVEDFIKLITRDISIGLSSKETYRATRNLAH